MGIGDHDTGVITDTYCCPQRHKPVKRAINCWNRANIGDLRTDMLNNLTTVCQNTTIDTPINNLWENLKSTMLNTQKLHVPTKMTSQRISQPWLTQECKRASRKKKRRYNRFKLSGDPRDWKNFQERSRRCN